MPLESQCSQGAGLTGDSPDVTWSLTLGVPSVSLFPPNLLSGLRWSSNKQTKCVVFVTYVLGVGVWMCVSVCVCMLVKGLDSDWPLYPDLWPLRAPKGYAVSVMDVRTAWLWVLREEKRTKRDWVIHPKSIRLYIYIQPSIPFIPPSMHPFIYLSIHPSIHLFICPFIHPLVYSSIHPTIHSSTLSVIFMVFTD